MKTDSRTDKRYVYALAQPEEPNSESTIHLDDVTYNAIEGNNLEGLVSYHLCTNTGRAKVRSSLYNLSTSAKDINQKQEALREIDSNPELFREISKTLSEVFQLEGDVLTFLRQNYPSVERGIGYLSETKRLIKLIQELPDKTPAESDYIKSLFRDLRDISCSESYKILGMDKTEEKPRLGSKLLGIFSQKKQDLSKIHEIIDNDEVLKRAFRAIGSLDELHAFNNCTIYWSHKSLPQIKENETHTFYAKDLVNSIQETDNEYDRRFKGKERKVYVPNDIQLNGRELTFLTGSNSGGKTSLSKSVVQAQILAQMGCYVPVSAAEISIAGNIFYQVGGNDTLADSEGGFGTQLKITKDILFSSTPKSLVVIDDLIEGTTHQEKTDQARDQLCGFVHTGANMIYVTHNHELAKEFQDKKVGQYLQVEFDGNRPTHKIIPGISTNSHADLVAQRIGFGTKDITKHLIEKGYLSSDTDLKDLSKYMKGGKK